MSRSASIQLIYKIKSCSFQEAQVVEAPLADVFQMGGLPHRVSLPDLASSATNKINSKIQFKRINRFITCKYIQITTNQKWVNSPGPLPVKTTM